MNIPSILRIKEERYLDSLDLDGSVLDLGGDRKSSYFKQLSGRNEICVLNMDDKTKPDIFCNLEDKLPIGDESYNNVLLINVLEHIYNYRDLIKEADRVIRKGGKMIIIVPFMFPYHPSPDDYHRFTEVTLYREIKALGHHDIKIEKLGHGVFSAMFLFIDRITPWPIRIINYYTIRHLVILMDKLLSLLADLMHKKYKKDDYALGYAVSSIK